MNRPTPRTLLTLLLLLVLGPAALAQTGSGVRFTENRGQVVGADAKPRPEILYSASAAGASLHLERGRLIYQFNRIDGDLRYFGDDCDHLATGGHIRGRDGVGGEDIPVPTLRGHRMDMELVGANAEPAVEAMDRTGGIENFYTASAPQGITGVRSWGRLVYHGIYPKIDMLVTANEHGTKLDFIVHPGGDAALIRMRWVGMDELAMAEGGGLQAQCPLGAVECAAPVSFQMGAGSGAGASGGARSEVASRYRITGDIVTFELGGYDRSKDLVIDPLQLWATFYGGSMPEMLSGGNVCATDGSGNILMCGYSDGGFPVATRPGGYSQAAAGGTDAFVAKFSPDGRRLWSTIIGGAQDEIAHGVAPDLDGNVYITGHTFSTAFPTTADAYKSTYGGVRDAFVAKFDSDGVRLWSTYFGGSGFDDGYGFSVDHAGNVALALTTASNGLATTGSQTVAGANDMMVVKFTGAGGRLWARYMGGTRDDYAYAAASDPFDNILVTGYTLSDGFPVTAGCLQPTRGGDADAFVMKLSDAGTILWSTYLGGPGQDNDEPAGIAYAGIASDPFGNVFVTGYTGRVGSQTTPGFPTTAGAFRQTFSGGTCDGFVAKFSTIGALQWSTYLGGNGTDIATTIAANSSGGAIVGGFTASVGSFPVLPGAFQSVNAGGSDAFVMRFNRNGAQEWGTYFGGTGDDRGEGVAYDPQNGRTILVGQTTTASGAPFVMAGAPNPVIQATNAGANDLFITVFSDPGPPALGASGPLNVCDGDSLQLWVPPGNTEVRWYRWDLAHATAVVEFTAFRNHDTLDILTGAPGYYWAVVTPSGSAPTATDTVAVRFLSRINPAILPSRTNKLCDGDTLDLSIGTGSVIAAVWVRAPADTVSRALTLRVTTAGTWRCYVIDGNGCHDSALISVTMNPKPPALVAGRDTTLCEGSSATLTVTGGDGGTITWYRVGVTAPLGNGPSVTVTNAGTYTAMTIGANGCTTVSNAVMVKVVRAPRPKIVALTPTGFCDGDSAIVDVAPTPGDATLPGPGYVRYAWSNGATTSRVVFRTSGEYRVTVTDTNGCTGGSMITITRYSRPMPVIERHGSMLDGGFGWFGYRWYRNGEPIIGATSRSVPIDSTGEYVVEVTSEEGCVGRSAAFAVTMLDVELVRAEAGEGLLRISPNPTSGLVAVEALAPTAGPMHITVTDVAGRRMRSLDVPPEANGRGTIDLRDLPGGAYVVRVEAGEKRWSRVVVKQ